MADPSLEALQDLLRHDWRLDRYGWHLDRPLIHDHTALLRLVRRSPADTADELVERAGALGNEIVATGWFTRLIHPRRFGRLRRRLEAANEEIDQQRALAGAAWPSDPAGDWRFACAPDGAADPFAQRAALGYELAGRVLRLRPETALAIVNVYLQTVEPATGHTLAPCVLSVRFDRVSFDAQRHARVDPAAAVRRVFEHRAADDRQDPPGSVQPFNFPAADAEPLVEPLEQTAEAGQAPEDLADLQFDARITALLEAIGLEPAVVGGSAEDGVELEAHDPRPLVGGKVVVHTLRASAGVPVGIGPVRELYGVVSAGRAASGLLITSSEFAPEAQRFADGLPLRLVDGAELRRLLRAHDLLAPAVVAHLDARPADAPPEIDLSLRPSA